jgi:BMFP domain-containing protein YqiC
MQTTNRLFDDIARVANGAVTTLVGIKDEVEAIVRTQLEKLLTEMEMVPREEFEVVRDMAAKARAEQEALEKRVAELEAKLSARPSRAKSTTAKAKPKTAAKPRRRTAAPKS